MIGTLLDPVRRPVLALFSLLAVVAVVVGALLADRPPDPVPASAPAHEFSAERALTPLRHFATEPRPLGSPGAARARDYLAGALRESGFAVREQRAVGAFSLRGTAVFGRVDNIVATRPGRNPTGTVLLAAHYDSVVGGPGASDDGAAVAAILETVRALHSDGPPRNNLVVLLTDGEENGLLGSSAFVRHQPGPQRPAVVLNWEARGVSGPSLMFETSPHNAELVRLFASAAPQPRGDSSMVELYRMLPNDTDFTEFAGAGLTGMNFAYVEGAARYHTPGDDIAHLDQRSLQNHGANMLALTRVLGERDLSTVAADHDATYFPFLGAMVVYSDAWVWPLALLAAAVLLVLIVVARLRRLLSIPRLLFGVAAAVLPTATAALLAQGLWRVLLSVRPDYTENPFGYHPRYYELAVAVLAALAVLVWYLALRRRVGPVALAVGALAWLAALGLFVAWQAPGASYLFALPALACSFGGLIAALPRRRRAWPVLPVTAGVAVAGVFLVPLALGTLDTTGLATAGVAAIPLALLGLALLPVLELGLPPLGRPAGWRHAVLLPAVGILLVVALGATGVAVDRVDPGQPRRVDLAYLLDADTGRATWVSRDVQPAPWARQYVLHREPGPGPAAALADGPVWLGPAPRLSAQGPRLGVRDRRGDTLTLHVSSPRSAPTIVLRFDRRVSDMTVAVPGFAAARLTVSGTRSGAWPTELRLADLPPEGVDLAVRVPGGGPLRIAAFDMTYGLTGIRGFTPRPPGLQRSPRADSDVVVVSRTEEF